MKYARKFILGSGLRIVGLAAQVIVGLLLMPYIIHTLGDRIYGYWALVANFIGYYGLFDFGLISAVEFHVAKSIGENEGKDANEAISTSFFAFAILGSLIFLLTIGLALGSNFYISDAVEAKLFTHVLLIMGFSFAISFPCRSFIGAISAHLRYDLLSTVNLLCLLFRTGLILYVLNRGYGIVGLAAVTVLTDFMMYVFYFFILKRIQPSFLISLQQSKIAVFKKLFNYSGYAFLIKVFDQLRYYIHTLIVGSFIGIAAVTHYSISSRLSMYMLDLVVAAVGMMSPLFSIYLGRKDEDNLKQAFIISSKISVALTTFVALCLILFGKRFISMWMGKSYVDAYIPLVILVIGMFCNVSQLPSTSYLYGVAKHRFLMYKTAIEGILITLLSIYLAKDYGLTGVALGQTIPMAIIELFVQPIYVCRSVNISLEYYYIQVLIKGTVIVSFTVLAQWWISLQLASSTSLMSIFIIIVTQTLIAIPIAYKLYLEKKEQNLIMHTILAKQNS